MSKNISMGFRHLLLGVAFGVVAFFFFPSEIFFPRFGISLVCFGLSSYIYFRLSRSLSFSQTKADSFRVPFFLKSVSILLEAGVNLEKAVVLSLRDLGRYGEIVKRKISSQGLRNALLSEMSSSDSDIVKKAFSRLVQSYDSGGGSRELSLASESILSSVLGSIREKGAVQGISSVVLVALSLVLPVLLVLSYVVSYSLGSGISGDLLVLGIVALPFLSALVSWYISKNSSFSGIVPELLFCPASALVFFLAGVPPLFSSVLGILIGIVLSLKPYGHFRNFESLESSIDDFMVDLAGNGGSVSKTLNSPSIVGRCREYKRARDMAKKGVPDSKILAYLKSAGGDAGYSFSLAEMAIESKNPSAFLDIGERMRNIKSLKKEISSSLSSSKYTLILGSFLSVIILSSALNLHYGLSAEKLEYLRHFIIPLFVFLYSGSSSFGVMLMEQSHTLKIKYGLLSIILAYATMIAVVL